jgi:predicted DNA-binding protein
MSKMVAVTIRVTPAQADGLRRLSKKTGVPVAEYVREALGRVLQLAETQMRTLEKTR